MRPTRERWRAAAWQASTAAGLLTLVLTRRGTTRSGATTASTTAARTTSAARSGPRRCINYCNPHDDDADEQCEDADDPEDSTGRSTHVNAVAGWSSFFAGLVFFPTLVWVALLFAVPDPQAAAPSGRGGVAANATPSDDGIARIARGRATSGDHGPAPDCPGGQPQVIMAQPQIVQGGPLGDLGPAPGCQGAPSKLAEFCPFLELRSSEPRLLPEAASLPPLVHGHGRLHVEHAIRTSESESWGPKYTGITFADG